MPDFSPPKELTNGIFNEIEEDEHQYAVIISIIQIQFHPFNDNLN